LILIARQQQKISGHRMCVMMVNKSNGELPGILQTVFRGGSVCLPDSASSLVGSPWLGFLLPSCLGQFHSMDANKLAQRRQGEIIRLQKPLVRQSINQSIYLSIWQTNKSHSHSNAELKLFCFCLLRPVCLSLSSTKLVCFPAMFVCLFVGLLVCLLS